MFLIYEKPTTVKQCCPICSKRICKGSMTIRLLSGLAHGRYAVYNYFHLPCFILSIQKKAPGYFYTTNKLKTELLKLLL